MAETLAQGTRVLGYTIGRVLGRGGMGTVYHAVQESLHREVALKVMRPALLRSPEAQQEFLKEARAAASLHHPNLVGVHAVLNEPEHGLCAYAMEYLPGQTAAELVTSHGPLPRAKALAITLQIAEALGYAHQKSLVHRDVKPGNILVASNGSAKLLDLGLVQARVDVGTASGHKLLIVGTPDFCAPEQSRNPSRATPASDVFSLGCTLFFLLTGKPPFHGETVIDLIVRMAIEPLEYPDTIPADCRNLLELMLTKSSRKRLYDGMVVAGVLKAMARGVGARQAAQPFLNNLDPDSDAEGEDEEGAAIAAAIRRRRLASRRRK